MRATTRSAREELARARDDAAQALTRLVVAESGVEVLRAALELVPLGVVVLDASGGEIARNRLARGLVEARHGDALAAHLVSTVIDEASHQGVMSRTIELHGPPRRVLEVQAHPVVTDSGQRATVALIQDVTERHHLDAMRRDFVANVSHELRTPVGALGALAEALCEEDDPDVVRRLGTRISAEVERAADLISDLLDLSRVERVADHPTERVTVSRVVAEAIGRVRAVADERGIQIQEHMVPGLTLVGDPGQIVSALANLLDNAVKYSDPGSAVSLDVAAEGRTVQIRVSDHGIGIPARDHERIFERFYRVDRARSRETGGTGLGLAIVRHVALNHGGRVMVDSREGEGSTFTLVLPQEEQ